MYVKKMCKCIHLLVLHTNTQVSSQREEKIGEPGIVAPESRMYVFPET